MQGFGPIAGAPISASPDSDQVNATAAQTLGALTQTATGIDQASFAQAQTLGALTGTATVTTAFHFVAAQTLGALTQIAHGGENVIGAQTLDPLTQVATVAVLDEERVSTQLGDLTQVATGVFINRYFVADQSLDPMTGTEAFITQHYLVADSTLGALAQSATVLVAASLPDCGSGIIRPTGNALYALLRHLPEGVAWIAWRLPGKTAFKLMSAFARAYDDIAAAMCRLSLELDPRTTTEMVGEWEEALSLPDPCLPTPDTLDARRQRIMMRLSMRRWTTARDWHDLAALFGLNITITPGWCAQKPALYAACYPKRYDLFPRLGRFRVYIDIEGVNFGGYDYGKDGRGPGYPVPYGENATEANGFMCIIDVIRPANVVVLWNQNPQALPCVAECAAPANDPFVTPDAGTVFDRHAA